MVSRISEADRAQIQSSAILHFGVLLEQHKFKFLLISDLKLKLADQLKSSPVHFGVLLKHHQFKLRLISDLKLKLADWFQIQILTDLPGSDVMGPGFELICRIRTDLPGRSVEI